MPLLIRILIVGFLGLLNGCYVGEGTGYLRFEGKVSNEEGQPLDGREVRIQLSPVESIHVRNVGKVAHTQNDGKFVIETHGIVGVVYVAPIGWIVVPLGVVIAALTPWTNSEVQDFLRPSYTLGPDCLDHPNFISLRIDSVGHGMTFIEKDIVQKLYRVVEQKNGEPCTRGYDFGERKMSMGSTSRQTTLSSCDLVSLGHS